MAKGKGTTNDLENTTQKAKDWATAHPQLNVGDELRSTRKVYNYCSTCGSRKTSVIDYF